MDNQEAQTVLDTWLTKFVQRSYAELASLVGCADSEPVVAPSGVEYQIEVDIVYDDAKQQNLLIIASIDDGGWRSLIPLTKSLIMSPTGELL